MHRLSSVPTPSFCARASEHVPERLQFTLHPDGWVRQGAPVWMHADVAWVMAHDLVHHRPTDVGCYAHEVASLGAQWFVDHPHPDANAVAAMASSMHSVMLMGYEAWGDQGLRLDALRPPAADREGFEPDSQGTVEVAGDALVRAMRTAFERAWAETRDHWTPHGFERDLLAWLDGPDHAQRWVAHLLDGWTDAQRRWGSRANARRAFATVYDALEIERRPGAQVTLTVLADGTLGPEGIRTVVPEAPGTAMRRRSGPRP